MAQASKNIETVTVMKPVEEEMVTGVTLELSLEEAHVLKYLTGIVGGLGKFCNITNRVYEALTVAGIDGAVWNHNWNLGMAQDVDCSEIELPDNLS